MSQVNDAFAQSILTPRQRMALGHVQSAARRREETARRQAVAIVERAGLSRRSCDHAIARIGKWARIIVHFHPDLCGRDGVPVAASLLESGLYRNQFETGISNGSLTAFPGGPRDAWERTLFGGAYHAGRVAPAERPKYGALELVRFPDGPIPRFGSCYLILSESVKSRTSFTFMGSEHPKALGSLSDIQHFDGVMAALLSEVEAGGVATPSWPPYRAPTLGVHQLTVQRLFHIFGDLAKARAQTNPGRVLDTVIEAQIHGPLSLSRDVEEIVCDPSFRTTEVGVLLERIGRRYSISVSWHDGFSLRASEVPDDFRGERIVPLAQRIAGLDGMLTPAVIGQAWRSLKVDPDRWADWAAEGETARHLQQLWHTVVHYGSAARTSD
jgi:hypothetical protein